MEALAPFRAAFERPPEDPQPLPYLDAPANRERGALDIVLEVWLQTPGCARPAKARRASRAASTAQAAYWTAAQLVAHHTVNGCNLQPGDLLGSGTLSGPDRPTRPARCSSSRGAASSRSRCPTARSAPSWRTATR